MSDIEVTYFNNIWDVNNFDYKKCCRISTIISRMKDPNSKIAQKISVVRPITDDKLRKEAKKSLPVIMWQGIFHHRGNNGCAFLTGLMCIDVDHKTDEELKMIKQTVMGWGCTYCCFKSPSGDGLKVVIKTDNISLIHYGNFYRQVEQIFINQFGIEPDDDCEDVGRACYCSFDPDLYYNPNAIPLHLDYDPKYDKQEPEHDNTPASYSQPTITPTDRFIARLNSMRNPMTDEQIIKILDIRYQKFPDNYIDGNRTHSIFIQAKTMCEAGIDIENAIDYFKTRYLPTGYGENKLIYEVGRSYSKNAEMFGMKRGNYKPYSEYKKSKSNSN